jgi:tetratricopeptide (TPR) repeat protein
MNPQELVETRIRAQKNEVEAATDLLAKATEKGLQPEYQKYLIGLALYQVHEYEQAYESLAASYVFDEKAETAARVAVCAWRMNDLDTAEEWIKRAISIDPRGIIETLVAKTTPSFLAILSQIQLSAGKIKEARKAAEEALRIQGSDVAALSALATVQLIKGDGNGAAQSLSEAKKVAPEFIASHITREHEAAKTLIDANISMSPFAMSLDVINRIVV